MGGGPEASPGPVHGAAGTKCQGTVAVWECRPVASSVLALSREAVSLHVYVKAPNFKMVIYFFC